MKNKKTPVMRTFCRGPGWQKMPGFGRCPGRARPGPCFYRDWDRDWSKLPGPGFYWDLTTGTSKILKSYSSKLKTKEMLESYQ